MKAPGAVLELGADGRRAIVQRGMMIPQRTLRHAVTLTGTGLHTGTRSAVICTPAPVDAGISFVRSPRSRSTPIPARLEAVTGVRRGITLGREIPIHTVEHLVAAAAGMGITNLDVEVRGEELPALDGSADPYVRAFAQAGTDDQAAVVRELELPEAVWMQHEAAWILALPAPAFRATYIVPLAHGELKTQVAEFHPPRDRFEDVIAPARTWGFAAELEALRRQGLARGASVHNALGIGPQGYLSTPRFADEPARHKILDLIGDLALLGRPLRAHVIAMGAGHALHIALARHIEQMAPGS